MAEAGLALEVALEEEAPLHRPFRSWTQLIVLMKRGKFHLSFVVPSLLQKIAPKVPNKKHTCLFWCQLLANNEKEYLLSCTLLCISNYYMVN